MKLTPATIALFNKNLIACSSDKFTEINLEKLSVIKLIAAILTRALIDLHNNDVEQQRDAHEYLNSWQFSAHCEMLALSEEFLRRALTTMTNSIVDYDLVIDDFLPEEIGDE